MTTSNNIKGLVSAFENAQYIMQQATKDLLEGIFEGRDLYLIPQPLWKAIEGVEGAPTSVWVDYRHDGQNIGVFGVHQGSYCNGEKYYSVYGRELSEYSQDCVEDMMTYDQQGCAAFLQWYIENDWDNKINGLGKLMQGIDDVDAVYDVLEKWREEYGVCYFDSDDVDQQDLIDWAKDFTPIAE